MRLTVDAAYLRQILGNAASVATAKNIPILACVKIEAADETLRISGTDMDLQISGQCPATVSTSGSTCAHAGKLSGWVRALSSDATVEIEHEDTTLTLRSGRAHLKLQTLSAADFPAFQELKNPVKFNIEAADLGAMMNAASYAISTEKTRHYLCGIHLFSRDARLIAEATNGHLAVRIERSLPDGVKGLSGDSIIIPTMAVNAIRSALPDKGSVSVDLTDRLIRVTLPSGMISSKLIDGTYPDIDRALPQPSVTSVSFDKAALVSGIARIAAGRDMQDSDCRIRLAAENGELLLSSKGNNDQTEAHDSIEAILHGEPFETTVNSKLIEKVVNALDCETVDMGFIETGAPLRFTNPADARVLAVLMPLRG